MFGPNALSPYALAQEEDVSEATLFRWRQQLGTFNGMKRSSKKKKRAQELEKKQRRPQDWNPMEKMQAVVKAAELSDEELGEFLRREGLHEAQLEQWRKEADEAMSSGRQRQRRARQTTEKKRIKELERELRRKDKALAEAAALLVLKKKVQAIWGDEDEDTEPRNEK